MPSKIKKDYQPSQRVYELLRSHGCQNAVEFVGHELGHFRLYWEETGKKKENWDSTCLNWMKRQWEDKRHIRTDSGSTGDIFTNLLDKIEGNTIPEVKQRYKLPEIPASTETMTREEALEALAKLRKKL